MMDCLFREGLDRDIHPLNNRGFTPALSTILTQICKNLQLCVPQFRSVPCNDSAPHIQRRVLFYWALKRECFSYQKRFCSKHEGKQSQLTSSSIRTSRSVPFLKEPSVKKRIRKYKIYMPFMPILSVLYWSQFCFLENTSVKFYFMK